MKKRQAAIIIALILFPVIVGIIVIMVGGRSEAVWYEATRIGLVRIEGIIYDSEEYVRQLQELREDKTVAGVVVRIDSPGGAVAPSQEIYAEMMRYRQIPKPLVVSMGNVAASGGYYIASPASKIFANPGTITGSIGVVFSFPQYHQLLDKLGVRIQTITAGEFKDIASPNRDMTSDEKRILHELLDDTHQQFIKDINRVRDMNPDSLRRLADGRIFTGRQACKTGLVDTLGGYQEAVNYLRHRLGLSEKADLIEKRKRKSVFEMFIPEVVVEHFLKGKSPLKPAGTYFLFEGM